MHTIDILLGRETPATKAAVKLQSGYRGKVARAELGRAKGAASSIQRRQRGRMGRRAFLKHKAGKKYSDLPTTTIRDEAFTRSLSSSHRKQPKSPMTLITPIDA